MSLITKTLTRIQAYKNGLSSTVSTPPATLFPFSFPALKENKLHLLAVVGAVTVGLLLRVPGVFWGANFPTTWYGHHVDEYTHLVNTELLLFPDQPPRWEPVNPYPKGMAAHVAVPLIIIRFLSQALFEKFNTVGRIITLGRVINVIYGALTILIVYFLARKLFKEPRVALFATWLLAFGGIHVSQSHFFVSDVPSIFWFLAGTYFLLLDCDCKDTNRPHFFFLASACFGVSFGLKLSFFSLPTLAILALWKSPRLSRVLEGGALFLAGFVLVNYASYTPYDIQKTLAMGMISKTQIDRLASVLI
jgi:hypothetical protein